MNKDFIPYEKSLELKHLGFDEPCLSFWNFYTNEQNFNGQPSKFSSEDVIQLPTFSQAFRFFRELPDWPIESWIRPIISEEPRQYGVFIWTKGQIIIGDVYDTHPEAEIGCLNRLIEIVKSRQV